MLSAFVHTFLYIRFCFGIKLQLFNEKKTAY